MVGMNIAGGMNPVDAVVDEGVGLAGWAAGSTLGAAAGSVLGPIGTGIGYMAGGFLGDMVARGGKNLIMGDPYKKMEEEQARKALEQQRMEQRRQQQYSSPLTQYRDQLYSQYGM
jgi:phage tail tape-measure protein